MIASEIGGRGAIRHRGRLSFLDNEVRAAMQRLLDLGDVDAASHSCTIDGTQLHYLRTGAGNREPLLMLHGAGGGAANWYRLLGPLSRNYDILVPDLPGFGLSDAVDPQPPLGKQVAALIHQMMNRIGVRPLNIVGTSFGGLVAARLAQIAPPKKLVLINTAGLWPEASLQLKTACMPLFQRLALKQTRFGARWTLRNILVHKRLPPDHERALAEYIYISAARTDISKLGRAYACFGGWRGQREVLSAAELRDLAPHTLIIWGEQDRFLPAPRPRVAAALTSGVELRMIPGVGHSPNWEAPDEVLNLLLEFFERDQ